MVISNELRRSLDALGVQLRNAEQKLKKTIGSRHENCSVCIREADSAAGVPYDVNLEFGTVSDDNGDFSESLKVVEYNGFTPVSTKSLWDLAVTERIHAAKYVPDLIDMAVEASDDLAAEATEAAEAIEQAIAKH